MILEAENEVREKFGAILVLNKNEERNKKRFVSFHTAVFERARN